MTRALITGGAGGLGLHLARRLLDDGVAVDLLDDFSRGERDADLDAVASRDGVRLITADLRDPGALTALGDDYRLIFHLAARLGVAMVLERPFEVLRDNTVITIHAVELAQRQRNLHRLVFASTSEVYAGTLARGELPLPTPESTPIILPDLASPRPSYLLSKLYGEALCRHSGVPFTAVRPHNVYGPRMGMAHVVPELLRRAAETPEGGEFPVYSVEHRRTFCFVGDAVEMLVRVAEADGAAGEVVNLGTQEPEVTIGELAALVLDVVGRTARIVPMPPTPGSPERRCPDMSKMAALTGYRSATPLREGLERTAAWYRAHDYAGS